MNDFPNLTVIATHMCGYDKWEEAKEFILGKDVYVDTSSTFWRLGAEKKRKLIDLHVTQRVLFGTDYPIERHKYCVESFLKLELSVMTGLKRYSSQMLKNSFFLKKSRKVKK